MPHISHRSPYVNLYGLNSFSPLEINFWRVKSHLRDKHHILFSVYINTCFVHLSVYCGKKGETEHSRTWSSVCMSFHLSASHLDSAHCFWLYERRSVWHVRVFVWPRRKDQISFTLTRKFGQEKTDDCLCLSLKQCNYSQYHQVMIFTFIFFQLIFFRVLNYVLWWRWIAKKNWIYKPLKTPGHSSLLMSSPLDHVAKLAK